MHTDVRHNSVSGTQGMLACAHPRPFLMKFRWWGWRRRVLQDPWRWLAESFCFMRMGGKIPFTFFWILLIFAWHEMLGLPPRPFWRILKRVAKIDKTKRILVDFVFFAKCWTQCLDRFFSNISIYVIMFGNVCLSRADKTKTQLA